MRPFVPVRRFAFAVLAVASLASAGCGHDSKSNAALPVHDYSYAPPGGAVVRHLDLDLTVDFDARRIRGTAAFDIEDRGDADRLVLDTWGLRILDVTRDDAGTDETTGRRANVAWSLGDSLPLVGRPLVVEITPGTRRVVVRYETGDDARGVQWLSPQQTDARTQPFLYTQSQSILARTWVPCQDTPAVRFTYRARVRVPPGLMALMSARNPTSIRPDGVYTFEMPQPIPSYLLALAVGDLEFRAIGRHTGVYAEPTMISDALWEFIDMERMLETAQSLYGPYRWERFDVLVLPPSFPYGGMENPRLTFVTPVLVAGDRSLVSTIAHELAHSWSGNLVTMAEWGDFWLNEGFTTYFERRIMEKLYGRDVAEMQATLGYRELLEEIEAEGPESRDTALHIPLEGRDPDEELGTAPYEKGYLFLRMLEGAVGRDRFDAFLRRYFDAFAFRSMTTDRFLAYMKQELLGGDDALYAKLQVERWAYEPGLPDDAPRPHSPRFARVEAEARRFRAGAPARDLHTGEWTSMEWQHFLAQFDSLGADRLRELDETFRFPRRNGEIQRSWYVLCIRSGFHDDDRSMDRFLVRVGRRWLIRPIYTELVKTPSGREHALRVYARARPGYHSVTRRTIDAIVGWPPPAAGTAGAR